MSGKLGDLSRFISQAVEYTINKEPPHKAADLRVRRKQKDRNAA